MLTKLPTQSHCVRLCVFFISTFVNATCCGEGWKHAGVRCDYIVHEIPKFSVGFLRLCMLSTSFEKSGVLSAIAMSSSCFVCSSLSAALCLFLMNDSLENKDSQAYELPNITRSRHPTWLKLEYFSITSGDDQNDNPSSDNWAFIAESAKKSQISSSTSHCFRLGMNADSCSLHKSPAFKHGVVTISMSAHL